MDRIAAVACGDDEGPRKPDPATLWSLAEQLDAPIARLAMIGDTRGDLAMARAAGAGRSIGVRSGVSAEDELAPDADLVLGSIGELLVAPPTAA